MILLDANVISEFIRPSPDPRVVRWLDNLPQQDIWLTSIALYELHYGIELLPPGQKQNHLRQHLATISKQWLNGRVVDFDRPAAEHAAIIAADLARQGRPIDVRDLQIAGIAAARKATLATRNTRHFESTGVNLINPWDS